MLFYDHISSCWFDIQLSTWLGYSTRYINVFTTAAVGQIIDMDKCQFMTFWQMSSEETESNLIWVR